MIEKIREITQKVSKIRAFTDDSYLKTTHFAVFLLFGCSNELKETLERRASEIIVDKKAIAFLAADNREDITSDVRNAIDEVKKSGVDLENLLELHLCPLIVSDMAEPKCFSDAIDSISQYIDEKQLVGLWKPFIILNPEHSGSDAWLREIAAKTEEIGDRICRCCVLTREDEDNFAVAIERLLDTVIFVSLLHANSETRGNIGACIAYKIDEPKRHFYTAQTVFISNPIIMRTLRCMNMLLETADSRGNDEREPELGFTREILEPLYAKLPREGNQITFSPLYGVMPEPDGNKHEFLFRLRDFARIYYLSEFDINKEEIFARFLSEYLRSFINSGKPVEYMQSIIGNNAEIERLSRTSSAFQISSLPSLSRKSGLTQENGDVYAEMEQRLRDKLNSVGTELLREFFSSEEFISLPSKYNEARKLIRDTCSEFANEAHRHGRYGAEIYLNLIGDPDEKLVEKASSELSVQAIFPKYLAEITLAMKNGNQENVDEALRRLLDSLFASVRGLAGGSGAREYMEILSKTCEDPNGNAAKLCVTTIAAKFKFPLRFTKDGRKKYTFLWGSKENNFYTAWNKQQAMSDSLNEFLPIDSKERFVLLTVSPAFERGDINGIVRSGTSAEQTAAKRSLG